MKFRISPYAKAYTGAAVTFLAMFDAATSAGSTGGDGVTSAEWIRIAVSTVAAGLGVFLTTNSPDPAKTPDPARPPNAALGRHHGTP